MRDCLRFRKPVRYSSRAEASKTISSGAGFSLRRFEDGGIVFARGRGGLERMERGKHGYDFFSVGNMDPLD